MKRMHEITILTNSARLALELNAAGVQLFLIGGEYRPDRMDSVGPMAVSTLNQVRGYTAFIGADGLSTDFGPSASDLASAHLHRQVVANAFSTVLLVDHSKFGNASLFQIVDWSQISTVVTDKEPDARVASSFSASETSSCCLSRMPTATVDQELTATLLTVRELILMPKAITH